VVLTDILFFLSHFLLDFRGKLGKLGFMISIYFIFLLLVLISPWFALFYDEWKNQKQINKERYQKQQHWLKHNPNKSSLSSLDF